MAPPVVAIDGHDGSGKSSIGAAIAKEYGLRLARPFADSLGDHIAWLWRHKQFALANDVARTAVRRVLASAGSDGVLCDRHWTTMFTVLPEAFWRDWENDGLPPTIVCWASTATTVGRLRERGEDPGDPSKHDYYSRLYRDLASRAPRSFVLNTSDLSLADAVAQVSRVVRAWLRS